MCATAAASPSYRQAWKEARAAQDRGDRAAAARIVDEALQRAGNSNDESVWALRVERAILLMQDGRREDASRILAQPLPPNVRNSATGARHVLTQAILKFGDPEMPVLLQKARAIAAAHAPQVLPEILPFLGEENAREAIRLARKAGQEPLALKAEGNLVRTYGGTYRYAEAIKLGESLRPRFQQFGLLKAAKTNLGNLGWLYSELGDYDYAVELLTGAVKEAGRMREYNEQFIWLSVLSNIHAIRRDWPSIVRDCEQVIRATANERPRSRAWAFSSLARAYLELGRIDDARNAAREALALETGNDALITRIVEARIDMATGRYDAARKTLADVIANTKEPDTKLVATSQLAHVHALTKQSALADKTFTQGVALVRQARESVRNPQLRLTVFNTASELFDNYVDFLIGANRIDDALRITDTSRAQTLAEALGIPPAVKLDARKIAAQRKATILCYWLGRRRAYVWTVTPASVKLTTIARSDTAIESDVEAYRAKLVTTAGTLERSRAQGQALFNLLVAPAVLGIPRGSRVIVVPDGKLHTLNFETLVTPDKRYWIEDAVLSHASSLQLLTRGTSATPNAPRMLLVGNPPKADPAFPPLPKAGEEIQRIQKHFGPRATVLAGAQATPARYLAAKPQSYDLVHFVAHGVASRTRPLESAVILALDPNRNYRLVAGEIARQPLAARLVTISSCHGAGAATYAGEGLVGLAWAFLHAGAEQVVAALWAVSDTAAPALMEDMYAGIRGGKDPAVALRDAKLRLLRSGTAHKHAKFWAPFIVYV